MSAEQPLTVAPIETLSQVVQQCTRVFRKGEAVTTREIYLDRSGGLKVTTIDAFPELVADGQVIDCHFVLVGFTEAVAPYRAEPAKFVELVEAAQTGYYGVLTVERLLQGPSYIEIGGWIGDQTLAFQFMALSEFLGLAKVITPATLRLEGPAADAAAGNGLIMCAWKRP